MPNLRLTEARLSVRLTPFTGKVYCWKRANGVIVALDVIPDDGTPSFRNDVLDNATSWKGYCDFIAFDPVIMTKTRWKQPYRDISEGLRLPFSVPFTLGHLIV